MSNRAFYIIHSKEKTEIYSNRWGASSIAKDLYLKKVNLVNFVNYTQEDAIFDDEGCILIDMDSNIIIFWEREMLSETSVRKKYLEILKQVWEGWDIRYAELEIYDIQKYLYPKGYKLDLDEGGSWNDYFLSIINKTNKQKIIEDEIGYLSCLVIIKQQAKYQSLHTSLLGLEITLYGEKVIPLLQRKDLIVLKKEADYDYDKCLVFDLDNNKIIWGDAIISYHIELQEKLIEIWKGWKIEIGNFGYIGTLQRAGIDTHNIEMTEEEADSAVNLLIKNLPLSGIEHK